MKLHPFLPCLLLTALSCNTHPGAGRLFGGSAPDSVYTLRLDPEKGSRYDYDIANESNTRLEVNDKKVDNISKSSVGVTYKIDKDSLGDFLFWMSYTRIHLYTQNGDRESDLDADNGSFSIDPVEKLLGALKGTSLEAVIGRRGGVQQVTGYKELAGTILAGFKASDTYARNIAQKEWEEVIEKGIVRKNMEQLFNLFPDSAVHVGDRWTIDSKQTEGVGLNVRGRYTLESVDKDVASIAYEGEVTSDSAAAVMMGYNVTARLTGYQEGEYDLEVKTGMLKRCDIKAKITGELEMAGRDIPLTISNQIKVSGRRVN